MTINNGDIFIYKPNKMVYMYTITQVYCEAAGHPTHSSFTPETFVDAVSKSPSLWTHMTNLTTVFSIIRDIHGK